MRLAIIGGGAFGTALGAVFARAEHEVRLYLRDEEVAEHINTKHENPKRLGRIKLPQNLRASTDMQGIDAEAILLVLPAQSLREWLDEHKAALGEGAIICCAKGIERQSGKTQSALVGEYVKKERIFALSGPGFAEEIAQGLPTALAIAGHDAKLLSHLQAELSTSSLRLYASDDVFGVEFGGALKNVIAIGCGVAIGARLGASARAALFTRGFSELMRLGAHLGARAETLSGLSGLGDLMLTASSKKSRNYALGLALGRGNKPDAGKTVEGLHTARMALEIALDHGFEVPVIESIAKLCEGSISVTEALDYFFSRPLGRE